MNYSTAIFLINDQIRGIQAIYEAESVLTKPAPRTTFKTFDKDIKEGDLILVPTNTRHNVTVCKVVAVDVEVDLESHIVVDWIIGVVDTTDFKQMQEMEQAAVDTIKSAEKNRKRDQLRQSLMADSEAKLMALPIAALNKPVQLDG